MAKLSYSMNQVFIDAFRYKKWSDERTLRAIDKIVRQAFPDSYAFVLQQLNHMVIVEELFSSRLKGSPVLHAKTNTEVVPAFNELENRLTSSCDWYGAYVSTLENAERQIAFTFADDHPGMMKVQEILFHILTHGSYHRGNIARELDLASVPHPVDGYAAFIHEQEPERRKT